jgi:hypothetical protein
MKTWPKKLNVLYLSTKYLLQGNVDFFFIHCNSESFKKVTRLNKTTFELLYAQFDLFWQRSFSSHTQGHLRTRVFIGRACLGLCLHYFASDSLYSTFALFFGINLATLSRYINWTLSVITCFSKSI